MELPGPEPSDPGPGPTAPTLVQVQISLTETENPETSGKLFRFYFHKSEKKNFTKVKKQKFASQRSELNSVPLVNLDNSILPPAVAAPAK